MTPFRVEAASQGSISPVSLRRNIATTYFGGAQPYDPFPIPCGPDAHDRAQGVSMLSDGRILIAGNTVCQDFNTVPRYLGAGGFFTVQGGGSDGYVAILSSNLTQVEKWTYLPGANDERAYLAVKDSQQNIWVVGFTESGAGFTGLNTPIGPCGGPPDTFVVKFNSTLTAKLWAVRIGGNGEDNPRASLTVVDEGGVPVAYVSGHTGSTDFPITTGIGENDGCYWDAFVCKLDAGGGLIWSRIFGGNGYDDAYANVRVHPVDGSIYVGGFTRSTDLEARYGGLGGYDTVHNGSAGVCGSCPNITNCTSGDGFVARLNGSDGSVIRWTYLGGTDNDTVSGNDGLELVPGTNQVVVIGNTKSATWPFESPPPFQLDATFNGVQDAYVAIFSDDLGVGSLQFHTFFGGESNDEPGGLAVDDVGNIYFGGNTCSPKGPDPMFPITSNAYDQTFAADVNGDAFLAKLNVQVAPPQSATLHYSTYIGGGLFSDVNNWDGCPNDCSVNPNDPKMCPGYEGDRVRSLMLMPSGYVLCCGDTDTTDFPTWPKVGPNEVLDSVFIGGDSDAFTKIHNTN